MTITAELVGPCHWNGQTALGVLGEIRGLSDEIYALIRKLINAYPTKHGLIPLAELLAQIINGFNPHLIKDLYGVHTVNANYSMNVKHINGIEWEITIAGSARNVPVKDMRKCVINTSDETFDCPIEMIRYFENI
jgi:hypothetical protein